MEHINTEFQSYNRTGAKNKSTESNDSTLEKLLSRQVWITNQLRNQLYESSLKNRYDSLINSIILDIYKSRDIQEIFRNVAASIHSSVDSIDMVLIYKADNGSLRLAGSAGIDDAVINEVSLVSGSERFIWNTVNQNRTIECANTSNDVTFSGKELKLDIHSYLSTTIKYKGRAYGSIILASSIRNISDKENKRLVETVGLQLEIALKHHFQEKKLIESQVELEEKYTQLKKLTDHETVIRYIAENVHKSINIEEVLDNSASAMCNYIYSAQNVSIFLVEDNYAVLKTLHGTEDNYREYRLEYPAGITWKILADSKPRIISDLEKETGVEPFFEDTSTSSLLSVPLIFKGKTIGVIHIASSSKNTFTHEDLSLLEIVARQIENAIKNAKQAELLKKANDELELRVESRTKNVIETNKRLLKEISERKKIEKDIKNSLKEKEVLLMEIHHRVKNNLQIITSLLNLQSKKITDENLRRMFNESKTRIKSMSILHEQLYSSKMLNRIDLKKYLTDLTNHISRSFGTVSDKIAVKIQTDGAFLDINKAIPCGLMVNELVSNAFEHGFTGRTKNGCITIDYRQSGESFELSVKNNGTRLPEEFDPYNTDSLGLQLVTSLCRQIKATLTASNERDVEFRITSSE